MIEAQPGSIINIDSGCYPQYTEARVIQSMKEVGYVVDLAEYGQTIIFNSEVIGMADDGQSPSDILNKIRPKKKRTRTPPGAGTPGTTPGTVDPKVFKDAMDQLKKKVEEKVPNVKNVKDPIEAYDRAMKGVM